MFVFLFKKIEQLSFKKEQERKNDAPSIDYETLADTYRIQNFLLKIRFLMRFKKIEISILEHSKHF